MIDVLIRTHNSEKTIERCLLSVLEQTFSDYRVIVSDDCSDDLTTKIIKEKYPTVELHINEKNLGAGLNRKQVLSYATSEFVTFLDADDFLDSNYLEEMNKKIKNNKVDIVKCSRRIITPNETKKYPPIRKGKMIETPEILKVLGIDFISNLLMRKSLFSDIEWFDKKSCEDGSLVIQLADKAGSIFLTENTNYNWVRTEDSNKKPETFLFHLNKLHSKLYRNSFFQKYSIGIDSSDIVSDFYSEIQKLFPDFQRFDVLLDEDIKKTISYIKNIVPDFDVSLCENKIVEFAKSNSENKENGLNVALCAIAKNENLYIKEWTEHYRKLGIKKIFLYDNNDIDGERFEDVINDYIDSGFVEIIDVRGVEKGKFYDEDGLNLQPSCYYKCYEGKLKGFDWVCFFDVDEFLDFRNGYNLQKYLTDPIFEKVDTILVGWQHYNDNNAIEFENKPCIERFPHESKMGYHVPKSIVRCGLIPVRKHDDNVIHFFRLEGERIAQADGTPFTKKGNWLVYDDISTHNCFLRHFKTKTLQEFIKRHLGRFWGTSKTFTNHQRTYFDIIREFFKYNDVTPEKVEYITQGQKIIALTSWERRVKILKTCISNIREKCGASYRIVITLCTEEFPNKEDDLPYGLIKFIEADKNTEIIWVKRNYKPFKKILFAMEKYPNSPIISADDDCLYKYNYADELYNEWIKEPDKVVTSQRPYEYEIDGVKIPFAHGRCTIYPPSCIIEYKKYIENDNILSTNNDDSFYGICLHRKTIGIKYLKHLDEDMVDFITSEYSLTMNGGSTPESLKLKYFRDKKIIISELNKSIGKKQQIIKYK